MSRSDTIARAQKTVIKNQRKRIEELEKALKPFTHTDLTEMLGGCAIALGDENVIYQRNKAILKIKHFKQAQKLLEK